MKKQKMNSKVKTTKSALVKYLRSLMTRMLAEGTNPPVGGASMHNLKKSLIFDFFLNFSFFGKSTVRTLPWQKDSSWHCKW
jgi:hypothetical protein